VKVALFFDLLDLAGWKDNDQAIRRTRERDRREHDSEIFMVVMHFEIAKTMTPLASHLNPVYYMDSNKCNRVIAPINLTHSYLKNSIDHISQSAIPSRIFFSLFKEKNLLIFSPHVRQKKFFAVGILSYYVEIGNSCIYESSCPKRYHKPTRTICICFPSLTHPVCEQTLWCSKMKYIL